MEVLKKLHVGQSGLFKPSLYVLLSTHKSNNSTINMMFKHAGRFKHYQLADGSDLYNAANLQMGIHSVNSQMGQVNLQMGQIYRKVGTYICTYYLSLVP